MLVHEAADEKSRRCHRATLFHEVVHGHPFENVVEGKTRGRSLRRAETSR